jgi:maltoporin
MYRGDDIYLFDYWPLDNLNTVGAGAQLGAWLRPYVFANVWFRAAGGLAAYGELNVPSGLDPTRSVGRAREALLAFSLNWESKRLGVMGGGYVRRFNDASSASFNPQSYTEGIIAVRPHIYWNEYFHTAVELSYQARRADGIDYVAGRVLTPQVFRASILPLVAPMGRGTYSRPQIYLIYTVSAMNDDARLALYDPSDYRYAQNVVHYLGTGVEWWFNSSYR